MNERIIEGTCSEMCPIKERAFRIKNNLVSTFELDNKNKPDERKMIKEYRRSAAGQMIKKEDLRTEEALIKTMDYLILNIVDKFENNNSKRIQQWYDFIWNRTRSIRKDITIQQLNSLNIIYILERCVRFHIICSYRLCEERSDIFDFKINEENLVNSIQILKEMYELDKINNQLIKSKDYQMNKSEFLCYYILINLDNDNIIKEISNFDKSIRNSDSIKLAIKIFLAYKTSNYYLFTRLLIKSNLLISCILNRYLNKIRLNAFFLIRKSILIGNGNIYLPQQYIMNLLLFKFNELKSFCKLINCDLEDNRIVFCKSKELNLDLKNFKLTRNSLIEHKFKNLKFSNIINNKFDTFNNDEQQINELLNQFKKVDFFNDPN